MAKPTPGHCHYCDAFGPLTRDHIIPKARGGTNETWNLVGSCQPCNGRKADDLPTCRCETCTYAIDMHWQWIMQQPFRQQSHLIDRVGLLFADHWDIPPGWYSRPRVNVKNLPVSPTVVYIPDPRRPL